MALLQSSNLKDWLFLAMVTYVLKVSVGQVVTFIQQPQDTKAVVGQNAFFPCTYTGTRGVPHWMINQTITHVVSQLPLGHSYNGTGLIVHKVDVSMNATTYQCCFEIHIGQGFIEDTCSSAGMLIINAGFIEHPTPVQAAPGELGRFQCTAVATSVCSIQWRINRTLMIDSEANAYSIPARTGVGMLSSTLHVLAEPQHNNSEVECCAYSDSRGEEICTNPVSLTIIGVPTKPGTPTFSSLLSSTSTSLTIEIQLAPEGIPPIISIAINFTSTAGLVRTIPGPFSPGQLVTATLNGLEADTEYNFTLFAVNFNGLSPASVETNSRTGPQFGMTAGPQLGVTAIIGISVAAVACAVPFSLVVFTIGLGWCCIRARTKRISLGGELPSTKNTTPPHRTHINGESSSLSSELQVVYVMEPRAVRSPPPSSLETSSVNLNVAYTHEPRAAGSPFPPPVGIATDLATSITFGKR